MYIHTSDRLLSTTKALFILPAVCVYLNWFSIFNCHNGISSIHSSQTFVHLIFELLRCAHVYVLILQARFLSRQNKYPRFLLLLLFFLLFIAIIWYSSENIRANHKPSAPFQPNAMFNCKYFFFFFLEKKRRICVQKSLNIEKIIVEPKQKKKIERNLILFYCIWKKKMCSSLLESIL